MATPYSDVFKRYLRKIQDDLYGNLTQHQGEDDMIGLMDAGLLLIKFPRVDINDRDDELKEFANDLPKRLQELISVAMKHEWCGRQIYRIEHMRQKFTQSDFKLTSQQAHLDKLIESQNQCAKELGLKLRNVSYTTESGTANWSNLAGDGR